MVFLLRRDFPESTTLSRAHFVHVYPVQSMRIWGNKMVLHSLHCSLNWAVMTFREKEKIHCSLAQSEQVLESRLKLHALRFTSSLSLHPHLLLASNNIFRKHSPLWSIPYTSYKLFMQMVTSTQLRLNHDPLQERIY